MLHQQHVEVHGAFDSAVDAPPPSCLSIPSAPRLDLLQRAILSALDRGDVVEARRLLDEAVTVDSAIAYAEDWARLRNITTWLDSWLIAAVRCDPPDAPALDELAARYWKPLFARCQVLTVDREQANDLAQEAWCRVLRARHGLKPEGNFLAYLRTIATNLWRDHYRAEKRAGPMGNHRLVALDAAAAMNDGETVVLADTLPDLNSLDTVDQTLLALDIDQGLRKLTPLLRDVLTARFLTGESCAEIGRRHGRTEQTISAWVREAARQMKDHLEEPHACLAKDGL
jgi:RNA polymerase sigma factor (sigma-70 family)